MRRNNLINFLRTRNTCHAFPYIRQLYREIPCRASKFHSEIYRHSACIYTYIPKAVSTKVEIFGAIGIGKQEGWFGPLYRCIVVCKKHPSLGVDVLTLSFALSITIIISLASHRLAITFVVTGARIPL